MQTVLDDDALDHFVAAGYVRVAGAFDGSLAARCVTILSDLLPSPVVAADPATWTHPVVRIAGSGAPPLLEAINSTRLVGAIDQLVGVDRWQPRRLGYGTFPVRFPSTADPGDTGWHVDGGFGDPPWYRVNLASRGRALLLLMLFTDVAVDDAPTRLLVGSHADVARSLVDVGPEGCTFDVHQRAPAALERPTVVATGSAGDVFVCHPFLVHAASWPHRGTTPRYLGQPAIHHPEGEWLGGFTYDRSGEHPPVERAVIAAIT